MQGAKEAVHQLADDPLSPEEARESYRAWQDYIGGKDPGKSLEEVKEELLGTFEEKHWQKGGKGNDICTIRRPR
ncbi:MAG: hypothetical protein ACOYEK_07380 [bacterium]